MVGITAILKAIAILIEHLEDLGEPVADLKAACNAEALRIRARQAANESEAAAAMGLPSKPPTD